MTVCYQILVQCIIEMIEERGQCSIAKPGQASDQPPKMFTFDGSYFTDSTTEQIYNDIAYPLVEVVSYSVCFVLFSMPENQCFTRTWKCLYISD